MSNITPAEARAISPYLAARYPESEDELLQELLNVEALLVSSITGRAIAPATEGEAVPDPMQPLAVRCVVMKAEQLAGASGTLKDRKRSLTRGNLASFAAGAYSETYWGPQQILLAKKLDADPVLAEFLWALCTEEMRLYWLSIWDPQNYSMVQGGVVGFEWGNRPNYTPRPGWPRWPC